MITAGLGGRTRATLPVTPGETLTVVVGGTTFEQAGGFNGGGDGGTGTTTRHTDSVVAERLTFGKVAPAWPVE